MPLHPRASSTGTELHRDVPVDFVTDVVEAVRAALGEELVGLYLYGSAVSRGFDAGVSDMDFVAITAGEVARIDLERLREMHGDLIARHPDWEDRLEIVYVGRAAVESFRTSQSRLAVISPGEPFHLRNEPPSAWVQNWYLLRRSSIAFVGPDASEIVPDITWAEFADALRRHADRIRTLRSDDAGPGLLAYRILTLCRTLHAIRKRHPGSKHEGATWVARQMPQWSDLIEQALATRQAGGRVGFADSRDRAEVDRFMEILANEIAADA